MTATAAASIWNYRSSGWSSIAGNLIVYSVKRAHIFASLDIGAALDT